MNLFSLNLRKYCLLNNNYKPVTQIVTSPNGRMNTEVNKTDVDSVFTKQTLCFLSHKLWWTRQSRKVHPFHKLIMGDPITRLGPRCLRISVCSWLFWRERFSAATFFFLKLEWTPSRIWFSFKERFCFFVTLSAAFCIVSSGHVGFDCNSDKIFLSSFNKKKTNKLLKTKPNSHKTTFYLFAIEEKKTLCGCHVVWKED